MAEHQQLTSIEIEDFTSIQSARVELRALNVLIGANGSGKSNFIKAFDLLGNVGDGMLNLFVGLNGGASALINDKADSQRITLTLETPLQNYQVCLKANSNDEMLVDDEVISYHGSGKQRPWTTSLGRGHRESRLTLTPDDPSVASAAAQIATLLRGCRAYHFHGTSSDAPVKRPTPAADNLALNADAGNIAAVLLRLRDSGLRKDKGAYRRIVGAVRLIAPFFGDFVLQPDNTDRLSLQWQDAASDTVYPGNQLSDGTLRFACLATLLLQPELPKLVIIDEPELGLHPVAVGQLADLLRVASIHSQVLIATQSVTLLNQFSAEDVVVAGFRDGNSAFIRPNTANLQNWLAEYSLGELWEKNIIGGHPGSLSSVLDPGPEPVEGNI